MKSRSSDNWLGALGRGIGAAGGGVGTDERCPVQTDAEGEGQSTQAPLEGQSGALSFQGDLGCYSHTQDSCRLVSPIAGGGRTLTGINQLAFLNRSNESVSPNSRDSFDQRRGIF